MAHLGPTEKHTLERLDSARTMEFLTGIAAGITKHERLSRGAIDELRVTLTGIQQGIIGQGLQASLFIEVMHQSCEVVQYALCRYGEVGFCRNMLRHSMLSMLNDSIRTASELGQALLDKVNLVLNRPLFVTVGGKIEGHASFSTALIDLTEVLEQACSQMLDARNHVAQFLPSALGRTDKVEFAIDDAVASQLGFSAVRAEAIPFHTESQAKRLFCVAAQSIVESVEEFCNQMRVNLLKDTTAPALVNCDSIRSELQFLASTALPDTDNVELWELKRLRVVASIDAINRDLSSLTDSLSNLLSATRNFVDPSTRIRPEELRRAVVAQLMHKGTPSQKASQAAGALFDYCRTHSVTPTSLIAAELGRIDPLLVGGCEKLLQSYEDSQSLQLNVDEKQENLRRSTKLRRLFEGNISAFSLIALFLATGITGCGLKGSPKSQIDDLRPTIPFRSDNTSAPSDVGN